ncbi:hypothetical protein AB1N83_014371 [Pleurotus pulmonarius]
MNRIGYLAPDMKCNTCSTTHDAGYPRSPQDSAFSLPRHLPLYLSLPCVVSGAVCVSDFGALRCTAGPLFCLSDDPLSCARRQAAVSTHRSQNESTHHTHCSAFLNTRGAGWKNYDEACCAAFDLDTSCYTPHERISPAVQSCNSRAEEIVVRLRQRNTTWR